jgi:hypothetical protein
MEWRIGVHLGDVLVEGEDILGDGVNIAARLEGIAEGVNVMAQIRKPKKPNPQELARREDIFRVYRDLGPARSYNRLIAAIRDRFGEVNKRQLMTWSKEYSWQERLHVHDAEEEKRRALAERDELDPNFDQQDALLRAAAKALKRALEATVTVAIKPGELKALVDTAINAIKLVEMLRSGDAGKKGDGAGNKRMFAVLDALEARLRGAQVIDVTPGAIVPAATVHIVEGATWTPEMIELAK